MQETTSSDILTAKKLRCPNGIFQGNKNITGRATLLSVHGYGVNTPTLEILLVYLQCGTSRTLLAQAAHIGVRQISVSNCSLKVTLIQVEILSLPVDEQLLLTPLMVTFEQQPLANLNH